MKLIRVALAQINLTVGDIHANGEKIINYIQKAEDLSADIVVLPELAVTGYPPEDLLLKPQFIKDNMREMDRIKEAVGDILGIVGFVDMDEDIYNAAAVIYKGEIIDRYHKVYLPNYGVFDELRYFQAGDRYPVYKVAGVDIGINICEDIWYPDGPYHFQALRGAEMIININASPYSIGKSQIREKMLTTRALDNEVVVAYLNMVGGQDELVFDGHSLIVDQRGEIIVRGRQFEEDMIVCDIDIEGVFMKRLHDPKRRQEVLSFDSSRVDVVKVNNDIKKKDKLAGKGVVGVKDLYDEIYTALLTGTRDYVEKNGFESVIVGLSGGIDSSLVACIAADALGKDNLNLVFMPSGFTSAGSVEDAKLLAQNLDIKLLTIPISRIFEDYLESLSDIFMDIERDVTEENLQARIRGNLLMALSNKFGWLVLTTGNKSEMSVGYATLYGDMAGGFAVIKDVSKTLVYELAKWRNGRADNGLIPERVLWKEPSAELRENQKDSDSLPPYPVLDPVLKAYIEDDMSFEEILHLGCSSECAEKVVRMVDRSEYKRRQSPPGIKITLRAFGRDRRFPITNRYRSF
ncbi:glutamine-dependent NAD(+) synthetase [bacterium BMS3Abin07]|nr:glutamine-dependent NAD(+) synthetase [bacterium BMS3Abin07]GBE31909.1 glutamine-dependent NAD(+) synthetase [bacterium BMS3Bbin05]HDO22613.1 NAD+ synthase [Nitrospirota bacterium]